MSVDQIEKRIEEQRQIVRGHIDTRRELAELRPALAVDEPAKLAAVDDQIAAIDSSLDLAGLVIGELERRLVVAKAEAEAARLAGLREELETLKARRLELSDQIADALAGNASAVPALVDEAKQTAKRLYGVAVDCGEHPRNAVEYVTNFCQPAVMDRLRTRRDFAPEWMKS